VGEGVEEIAVGIFPETLQRHGTAGRIADQAFQLIAAMRRDLGVSVQGKPLHAGTGGDPLTIVSPLASSWIIPNRIE
jgi:hypothetical protein